jgi:hypothetical protein
MILLKNGLFIDTWIKRETEAAAQRQDGASSQLMDISGLVVTAENIVAHSQEVPFLRFTNILRALLYNAKAPIGQKDTEIENLAGLHTTMYDELLALLPSYRETMSMQRVYKVVRRENDRLYSVSAKGKHRTEYRPGIKTEQPHMFLFTERWRAERWRVGLQGLEVWMCVAGDSPGTLPLHIPDSSLTDPAHAKGWGLHEDVVDRWWKNGMDGSLLDGHWEDLVEGSYIVNALTLVKQEAPAEGERELVRRGRQTLPLT